MSTRVETKALSQSRRETQLVGYFDTTHEQRVFIYGGKAIFVSLELAKTEDENMRRIVDEKLRLRLELGEGEYTVKEVWPPDWALRDAEGWS